MKTPNTHTTTIGAHNLDNAHVGVAGKAVVVSLDTYDSRIGIIVYDREIAHQLADMFLTARDYLDNIAQVDLDDAS